MKTEKEIREKIITIENEINSGKYDIWKSELESAKNAYYWVLEE